MFFPASPMSYPCSPFVTSSTKRWHLDTMYRSGSAKVSSCYSEVCTIEEALQKSVRTSS